MVINETNVVEAPRPAAEDAPRPTLALHGISKSYAAVAALTEVSLEVLPGEVHALLGENGAGKSTLMGVASGTTTPDRGSIAVLGETVDELTPGRATELGIAIVHQHPAVLPDLTVAENIAVAVPARLLAGPDRRAAMRAMLERVGCTAHLEDRVGGLSIAQKHLLELAKAMAGQPRLLILDEPTAPLGKESVGLLFDLIRSAAEQGTAVVYITHRLAEVRELADRVTVLRDGHHRGTAVVSEVTDDELLAMIVGLQLEYTFPAKHLGGAEVQPVLTVEGLSGDRFSGVSFTARRGEIIGVAGVVGNGQSDLLRALAGLDGHTGAVVVDGSRLGHRQLLRSSAYLPADRHHEGLMMSLSVRENAALSALDRLGPSRFVSRRREVELVGAEVAGLAVKTASLESPVTSLSGGNQQKVVLARSLLSKPAILLADEPTQGVDVGARAEIYRILREVSDSGVPVIVASSDAKELEGLCDRVIVLSRGHVVASLAGAEVTEERMVRAAVESTTHTRTEDARAGRRLQPALAAQTRGRLRARADPGRGDVLSRRLHLLPQRTLFAAVQCHLGDAAGQRARFHRPRPDGRVDDGRYRPVRRSTGGIPGGGRLVLPHRGKLRRGGAPRPGADGRTRCSRRAGERLLDQIRQVHPGGGHAGDVHRLAGFQFPPAGQARRPDQPDGDRPHHHPARPGPGGLHRPGGCCRRDGVPAPDRPLGTQPPGGGIR